MSIHDFRRESRRCVGRLGAVVHCSLSRCRMAEAGRQRGRPEAREPHKHQGGRGRRPGCRRSAHFLAGVAGTIPGRPDGKTHALENPSLGIDYQPQRPIPMVK